MADIPFAKRIGRLATFCCNILFSGFVWSFPWVVLAPSLVAQNQAVPSSPPTSPLQPTSNANGFRQYDGQFVTLVTDLPHSDALGQLPRVFDSALPMWGNYFGIEESSWSQWKCTCYLIGDRTRFQQAGYFPANLPPFVHGYQLGDQLWCMDQPSDYYRRHLLLHEGTHWFMSRALKNPGPPWYMEGMAEKLATHHWHDGKLKLDVFPDKREGFEYWGRLKLIKQQRGTAEAPSLEAILRYGPSAHQQVEAYAWSWAAVWFLKNHPRSAEPMRKLQKAKIVDINSFTPKLLSQLRPHWNELTMSWNAWVQQLDYGGDVQREIPEIQTDNASATEGTKTFTLKVDQGWQDSGIRIGAGDRIRIEAKGRYQVGSEPEPWWCEPEGVTIEYYGGQPLGKVMGLIVTSDSQRSSERPSPAELLLVGSKLDTIAQQQGAILFRINEPAAQMGDNRGSVEIRIDVRRP